MSYKKELNFGHSNEGMYRNLLNKITEIIKIKIAVLKKIVLILEK